MITAEKVLAALRATHCDGTEVEIIRALKLAGIFDPEHAALLETCIRPAELSALRECERLLRWVRDETDLGRDVPDYVVVAKITEALAAVDKAREDK